MKLHTELGRLWFSSKIVSQKAKHFGMKVCNGSKMTKDKRKHSNIIFFRNIAYKYLQKFTIFCFKLRVFLVFNSSYPVLVYIYIYISPGPP